MSNLDWSAVQPITVPHTGEDECTCTECLITAEAEMVRAFTRKEEWDTHFFDPVYVPSDWDLWECEWPDAAKWEAQGGIMDDW